MAAMNFIVRVGSLSSRLACVGVVFAVFGLRGEYVSGDLPVMRGASDESSARVLDTFVTMPDGVGLYTYGLLPAEGVKCPIVLSRTPYDGKKFPGAAAWAKGQRETLARGYARVVQQCRGSARSGGVRVPYVDERADSLACLAYLRTLPCYNGEIYLEGGSYLSSVHWAYLDACPADVKGAVLNIQCADRYPVVMHNGFLKIGLHAGWYLGQYKSNDPTLVRHKDVTLADFPLCDFTRRYFGDGKEGPLAGLDDVIFHPRPEDPFWTLPGGGGGEYRKGFTASKIPILMVTGWYDIYADALCDQWREATPERKRNCALVIDAFNHGGRRSGEAKEKTSIVHFPGGSRFDGAVCVSALDWFDHVRGGAVPKGVNVGGVTWYNLWENAWHRSREIPAGAAQLTRPLPGRDVRAYEYDPLKPARFPQGCGIGFGQISAMPKPDFRPDVLTYLFEPEAETRDIVGRPLVALRVKSDCEDTAFYVRISVKKAGTNVFYGLRESIKALTWDEGAYVPGTVRTLRFTLGDIAFRLGAGDVLRLDVSSSNAAMFAPHGNVPGLQANVRKPQTAHNAVLADGSSLDFKCDTLRPTH